MSWFTGKRKVLNFILPLLLALIFFSLSSRRERTATWHEAALINLITPIQQSVSFISGFFSSTWSDYIALVNLKDENKVIKNENHELRMQLIGLEEERKENERLRSLLDYKESQDSPTLIARVIANDPRSEFKSITIDKGKNDGIKIFMPVISSKGLVGRVGKVSKHASQVLLIVDPNSAVDVQVQRSRARAVLIGTARKIELKAGGYISRLEYLRRMSDIAEGDIIVTSGFDQIYPSGIPVGTVYDIKNISHSVFAESDVIPFENFAELKEVLVLLKENLGD